MVAYDEDQFHCIFACPNTSAKIMSPRKDWSSGKDPKFSFYGFVCESAEGSSGEREGGLVFGVTVHDWS